MARTESSSNLCPNTEHTHTPSHTHTHTHTAPTHMLSSVIIVMNGLSRQLALSTICHACDAPSAPLLVRYTAQFEKERHTERERETGSWCGRGRAAGRRRPRLVNRRKWLINERVMPTRGGHLLTPSRCPSLLLPLSLALPLSRTISQSNEI